MSITKITVSVGRTVNIGNYESIRAEISLEESGEFENADEVRAARIALNIQACKELDAVITNMGNLYRS